MSAVRVFVVIGFSALLVALSAPAMFENPPWPYSGVHMQNVPIGARIAVSVDRDSPAYRAGLRTGDELGCLSFRDSERLFDSYAPNMRYTPDPISLCALRSGIWRRISFVPKAMPPPGLMYGSPWIAALRLAVFLIFLIVGCALVIARPSLMTWLLFAYCCANLPWAAAQGMLLPMSPAWYAAVGLLGLFVTFSGSGLLALFTLVMPDDRVPAGWRKWTFSILAVATAAYLAFWAYNVFSAAVYYGAIGSQVDEAFTALTVLLVIVRLATMERAERARFGWAAFAIIFGIVCNVVRNEVANNTISIAGGVLSVVMPIALMYAILRRHVIDVRFVISRGVVYGVITTIIVGIIGLVDWATSAYLSQARVALAIDAAVTIGLGIALHRSYSFIEYGVDYVLFRGKHEAEAYLERSARALLRAGQEATVDYAVAHDPYEKLDLTMAALYRADGMRFVLSAAAGWDGSRLDLQKEHDLVRFLASERARVHIRDLRKHVTAEFTEAGALPAVAIPVFQGDFLFAFALYGLHRDGTRLDPDELLVLERLCESAAQAYMRIENERYHAMLGSPLPA